MDFWDDFLSILHKKRISLARFSAPSRYCTAINFLTAKCASSRSVFYYTGKFQELSCIIKNHPYHANITNRDDLYKLYLQFIYENKSFKPFFFLGFSSFFSTFSDSSSFSLEALDSSVVPPIAASNALSASICSFVSFSGT